MSTADEETARLLGRIPVFEALGEEDLLRVAEVAVRRSFAPGQRIFHEGDPSDTCYIVRVGNARAVREHPDGRTITLAQFGPGDTFGELAMFDDEKRSATVETLDDVEAIAILGRDMRRLMRDHSEIATKLVISLGRRLRLANERLARQSFQTVQSRVATAIADLVEREREADPRVGERDVLLRITQADVAKLAGSSRESASRFLKTLERAGVVRQGRGRILVHDPGALSGYVY
ncbi:MAG: Crp/Fnr family transcriptional regulator [Solirubrobacteraceae bacterium]|nr:Crp/Fnr family transcriptional regulator [Solirubrobacteraceae bacterium]